MTPMTCEEVFRRLDDYLDRELSDQEIQRLEEHLNVCEACLKEYEFEKAVLHNVKSKVRTLQVPSGLMSRISSTIREEA